MYNFNYGTTKLSEESLASFNKTVEKIQVLLELIDRDFRKKFNINNIPQVDMEMAPEYLLSLKKFYQFYLLCLIELCNKMSEIGLGTLGLTMVQLFQTFKLNMAYFFKFNIFFFKTKNLYNHEREAAAAEYGNGMLNSTRMGPNEFTQDQLNILRKFLLKQKNNNTPEEINKYEKLEKAKFYLEQEAQDLDQMLLVFNAAKDEVDEFIRKRVNLNTIKASGVTRFLQSLIRETKTKTNNTWSVLENENNVIDQREVASGHEKWVDDLKFDIINTVDQGQKKVLKQILKPSIKKRSSLFALMSTGAIVDKEVQTDDAFSISLSKKYANITHEKNELVSKLEFYEGQFKSLTVKNYTLEKKFNELESQKEDLKLIKVELELKLQRKKEKIKSIKHEKEDILAKLEGLIDKDSANKDFIQKKNWELKKGQLQFEEKERDLSEINQRIRQENDEMKEEVKFLKEELEKLNNVIITLKNQLNDELLKNMKNTKLIHSMKKVRRSSTFDTDPVHKGVQSGEGLFNEKLKTEENFNNFVMETEKILKNGILNEKSEKKNEFEESLGSENKIEKIGETVNFSKNDTEEENFESKKMEKKEKKNVLRAKSKKSVFSQQLSSKNFKKKTENEEMMKETNNNVQIKEEIKEKTSKNEENKKTAINGSFKKKTTFSFHVDTQENIEKKDFLEKYVENLAFDTQTEKYTLLKIIKKITKLDQKTKTFENLLKIIEQNDISPQIEKSRPQTTSTPKLKTILSKEKSLDHQIFPQNNKNENKANDLIEQNTLKTEPKNRVPNKLKEMPSSKQQLKNLMNWQDHKEIKNKIDDIDVLLYKEFVKFREANNLDVLKKLIQERILEETEKMPENNNQTPFTRYETEQKPMSQKNKTKSVPSVADFNLMNPFENNKVPQHRPTLTFSRENMALYRKLRTENGPRTTKSITSSNFQSMGLKDDNFGRRNSNTDIYKDFYQGKKAKEDDPYLSQSDKKFAEILRKNEEINTENFAKNKGFFKYPFRNINDKCENVKIVETGKDLEYSFDSFEKIYKNLIAQHEKCGPHCDHLKRFYSRVRFVNKYFHKEEVNLHKNLIDRINFPEDD